MSVISEFQSFIAKRNVMDLAVDVIIVGVFGGMVKSLTDDIILPVVGAIFGGFDFSSYFFCSLRAGRGLLPCFMGDAEPGPVRAGPVIDSLTYDIWITVHEDERQRPEVRMVIDRLSALFAAHADLFAGKSARV